MSNKKEQELNKLIILVHLLAIIQYTYSFYYDVKYVNLPQTLSPKNLTDFGGKFKYLTVLNVVRQFKKKAFITWSFRFFRLIFLLKK